VEVVNIVRTVTYVFRLVGKARKTGCVFHRR
jgi:hypothetical protein